MVVLSFGGVVVKGVDELFRVNLDNVSWSLREWVEDEYVGARILKL